MTIFCQKMTQITYNFDIRCIQVFFIDFQFFLKICQKLADFLQKNGFFYRFLKNVTYPIFAVNVYLVFGKWSDWSKNWYKCSFGYSETFNQTNFLYLPILLFYGARNMNKWRFWGQKCHFCPKIALFSFFRHHKNAKKANIKNVSS